MGAQTDLEKAGLVEQDAHFAQTMPGRGLGLAPRGDEHLDGGGAGGSGLNSGSGWIRHEWPPLPTRKPEGLLHFLLHKVVTR